MNLNNKKQKTDSDDGDQILSDLDDEPSSQDNQEEDSSEDNQEEDSSEDSSEDNQEDSSEDNQEDSSEDNQEEEDEDEQADEAYEPKYENVDLLDSIAIARETYFFNYMDEQNEINTVNERNVLKFIYEQVANTYTDVSLLEILGHIRQYYNQTFPEHERIVGLFYISVYPQALRLDRESAGIVQMNTQGHEINNSFVQIANSNFNPSNPFTSLFSNLINPTNPSNLLYPSNHFNPSNLLYSDISYNIIINEDDDPTQSNRPRLHSPFTGNSLNSLHGSSLLNEIMFLSRIFNMRSDESLTHILNLVNNVMENNNEEKQTATAEQIKELSSEVYETVGLENKTKNSEFCTICQENYSNESKLKILPCGHFFHCDCIEPWLLNCSSLCPICRKKI